MPIMEASRFEKKELKKKDRHLPEPERIAREFNKDADRAWEELDNPAYNFISTPMTLKDLKTSKESKEPAFVQNGKSMIDLGVGNGRNIVDLMVHVGNAKIVGVDIAPEVIERARKSIGKTEKEVELHTADICELPFGDNSFQQAVMIDTIESNSPERAQKAMDEAMRVLEKNGKLMFTVCTKPGSELVDAHSHGKPPGSDLAKYLMEKGHSVKKVVDFGKDKVIEHWLDNSYHVYIVEKK